MESPMRILRRFLAGLVASLAALAAIAQTKPNLTIYTYNSFFGKYGPGVKVKAAFEAVCDCTVQFVGAGDGGALVGRLKLEGSDTKADVVLGIDMNLIEEARRSGLFAPHGMQRRELALPIAWTDDTFLPFDWGHFAFIYDSTKLKDPPKSLRDLVETGAPIRILLQDPRSSAPGLGFLLWMQSVFGAESATMWRKLKPKIVSFTKGWSEAYALFLKGEADMVLSYTTSPAYHVGVENKAQYRAAPFSEGHYTHIETAAAIRGSRNAALARKFLEFMLSDGFQSLMPEGNWMFPAIAPKAGLPASFSGLHMPDKSLLIPADMVNRDRRGMIEAWLNAAAQ
jgi:thiamine transport system substrate-binding protein